MVSDEGQNLILIIECWADYLTSKIDLKLQTK